MTRRKKILKYSRKILIWSGGIALVILVLAIALDLYCEFKGVPDFVRDHVVVTKLAKTGIFAELDNVKVGLLNGIVIEGLTIRDPNLDSYKLFEAERVRISIAPSKIFTSGKQFRQIIATNGKAWIPLTRPDTAGNCQHVPVDIHSLKLFLTGDQAGEGETETRFAEVSANAAVHGTIKLRLENSVFRWTHDPDAQQQKLSLAPVIDSIPRAIRQVAREVHELSKDIDPQHPAQLSVQVNSDLDNPGDMQVRTRLLIRELLYNGLFADRIEAEASLNADEIKVEKLRVDIEDDEYLSASGKYNRQTGEITGVIAGRSYPTQIIRTFAPGHLPAKDLFRFEGPPPRGRLTIHSAHLDRLQEGRYSLSMQCREANLVDGYLRNGEVEIGYDDQKVTVARANLVLAPNVELSGMGSVDLRTLEAFARVKMDGDPKILDQYIPHKDFREIYPKVWQSFKFSSMARPRVEFDMYHQKQGDQLPIAIINGRIAAQSVSYNGVGVDQVKAAVLVDLTGRLLVIDELFVRRNGAPGIGQIAYRWQKDDRNIEFDAASNLNSSSLMTLIVSDWSNLLKDEGFTFQQTPYAIGSGRVNLDNPRDHIVHLKVKAPHVNWKDIAAANAETDLTLEWRKFTASGTAETVEQQGWKHENVRIKTAAITPKGATAAVNCEKTSFEDITFMEPKAAIKATNDQVELTDVSAKTVTIIVKDDERLVLDRAKAKRVVVKGDTMETSGSAEAARHEKGERDKEALTRAKDITAKITWKNKMLEISGKLKNLEYLPQNVQSPESTFKAIIKGNVATAELKAATATFQSGFKLEDASFTSRTERGQTSADFDIGKVTYEDSCAEKLFGRFNLEGDSWLVTDAKCKKLRTGAFEFQDLEGDAVYAYGTLSTDLFAKNLLIGSMNETKDKKKKKEDDPPWVADNVRAKVLYRNKIWDVMDFRGGFYDGLVKGRFRHDEAKRTTGATLTLVRADMTKLPRKESESTESDPMTGRLTGQAFWNIVHNEEKGMFIHGAGTLAVTEATIFKIPFIASFFDLISKLPFVGESEFGKITELRANLAFKGKRIDITRISTDGKGIALTGNGYYWWETGGRDIRIKADVIPLVNRFLTRRMLGTADDYYWEKLPGLKDLLRDTEKPIDPASPEGRKKYVNKKKEKEERERREKEEKERKKREKEEAKKKKEAEKTAARSRK